MYALCRANSLFCMGLTLVLSTFCKINP